MNQIPKYQQTPEGIMYFLQLFTKHNISYILFKCDHIFAGQNKNLDILFETDIDYKKAAFLLEKHNFIVHLSEKIEKYKTMYVGLYDNDLTQPISIHLHREVSWHGMKALDKSPLFEHKQTITSLIIIPSLEDSILIHSAHILFENFKITDKEKIYISQIDNKNINISYIRKQIKNNHWRKGFNEVIGLYKNNNNKIPTSTIFFCWSKKLLHEPKTSIYFLFKLIKKAKRFFSCKRKGILISLIGPNGSGKTTLTNNIYKQLQPLASHLNRQKGYYYGWDPILPTTTLARKIQGKKGAYRQLNETSSFSLFKELIIIYTFVDYITMYLIHIFPSLKHGKIVITDRYYYDNYAQHKYSEKSRILPLLLKLFPKPNLIYVLLAPTKILTKRDKNTTLFSKTITRTSIRTVHKKEELEEQTKRYLALAQKVNATILRTDKKNEQNTTKIVEDTWNQILNSN